MTQRNLMEPVRGLTFDMYGTLMDLPATFFGAFATFLNAAGHGFSASQLGSMWEREYLMESMVDSFIGGDRTPFEQVRRYTLHQVFSRFGVEHTADDIEKVLAQATPTLYPDVIDGMNKLRERYTLAVLSNGDLSALERSWTAWASRRTGPCRRSRPGATSPTFGCTNTPPKPWVWSPARSCMLRPILGPARRSGHRMRAVYINREGVPYAVGEPDIETVTLAEFAELAV